MCKEVLVRAGDSELEALNDTVVALHIYYLNEGIPYAGFVYHQGRGLYIVHWPEELEKLPAHMRVAAADFDFEDYIQTWEEHPNDYFWLVDYNIMPPGIKLYQK